MAQPSTRIAELLFRYSQDKASLNNVLAGNKSIQDQMNKTAATTRSLADVNDDIDKSYARALRDRGIDKIADQWRDVYDAERKVRSEAESIEAANLAVARSFRDLSASSAEIDRVADSIARMNAEQEKAKQAQTLGQQITQAGRRLFAAPDVSGSTTVARGLIGGGAAVDALGISVTHLGVAAAAAAVLALPAAIALDQYNKSLERGRRALEAALAAQDAYYTAVANQTSLQARAQIQQIEDSNTALRAQIEETRNSADTAFRDLAGNTGLQDLIARFADGAHGIEDLTAKADTLEAQLATNEQTIGRLTEGLRINAFVVNDLRAAEELLATKRREQAFELFQKNASDFERAQYQELEYLRLARNGTAKDVQQRLQDALAEQDIVRNLVAADQLQIGSLQERLRILNQMPDSEGDQTEAIAAIQKSLDFINGEYERHKDKLDELGMNAERLTGIWAALANKEKAFETAAAKLEIIFDASTRLAESQTAMFEAEQNLAKVRQASADKITGIAADRQKKEDEIFDKMVRAEDEAAQSRIKLAQDTEEKISRIRRDFGDKLAESIRAGNRVAARALVSDRRQAITDAQTDAAKQKAIIDDRLIKAYETANREIAIANDTAREKTAAAQRSGDAEIAEAQRTYDRARAEAQGFEAAMQAIQMQGNVTQQLAATEHQSNLFEIARTGGALVESMWKATLAKLASNLAAFSASRTSYTSAEYAALEAALKGQQPIGKTGGFLTGISSPFAGGSLSSLTGISSSQPVVDLRGLVIHAETAADVDKLTIAVERKLAPVVTKAVQRGVQRGRQRR